MGQTSAATAAVNPPGNSSPMKSVERAAIRHRSASRMAARNARLLATPSTTKLSNAVAIATTCALLLLLAKHRRAAAVVLAAVVAFLAAVTILPLPALLATPLEQRFARLRVVEGRHHVVGPDRRLEADRIGRQQLDVRILGQRRDHVVADHLYHVDFAALKLIDTPYNLYLHKGLPPTPIANPGRASIHAALFPAANPSKGDPLCVGLPKGTACQYLYYVIADTDGRHAFAVTLAQHEANVAAAKQKGLIK